MSRITPNELLASRTFQSLRRGLDFLAQRQRLTAENIANIDTPGFKAQDLDFQAHLDRIIHPKPSQLFATDPRHFGGPREIRLISTSERHLALASSSDEPVAESEDFNAPRNDRNTVDVDREMAQLAETQLAFGTYARLLSTRMESIQVIAKDVR